MNNSIEFNEPIDPTIERLMEENRKNARGGKERQLLHNSIQTPDGTILVSHHGHDFSEHTQEDGRRYFTDGGLDYQRIGFSDEEYTNLSLYTDDTHEKIRERFTWGNCYDKEMNRLPKIVYIKLKDITESHLNAILNLTNVMNTVKIYNMFKAEKKFRENMGE